MGELCGKVRLVCREEGSELNIKWESCVHSKVRVVCRVEGSELNIKWESCLVGT